MLVTTRPAKDCQHSPVFSGTNGETFVWVWANMAPAVSHGMIHSMLDASLHNTFDVSIIWFVHGWLQEEALAQLAIGFRINNHRRLSLWGTEACASPEFLASNAVRPQIVVLDAFCGIKNTQKSIFARAKAGALPRTPLGSLHRSPSPHTYRR